MKKSVLLSLSVLTVMCFALSGCGEKTPEDALVEMENWDEDDFEEAVSNLEEDYSSEKIENVVQPGEDEKIEFEASQEILDAKLSSGKIQILDDVFQQGGYFTIDEFIAQYGDKYDCSEIAVDEFAKAKGSLGVVSESNVNEPYISINRKDIYLLNGAYYRKDENVNYDKIDDVGIKLYYVFPAEEHTRLGDCIVYQLSYIDPEQRKTTWFPNGERYYDDIKFDYNFEDFASRFIEPNGMSYYRREDTSISMASVNLNSEVCDGKKFAVDCYEYISSEGAYNLALLGDDDNLLGVKPVYYYFFKEDEKTGDMDFLSRTIDVYYNCELLSDPAEW